MKTEEIRAAYLDLLERKGVTEEEIHHQFLARHPALLPLWWPFDNTVFTKLPLGAEYVVDFAFARENTPGVTWHLIEIEHPKFPLFTKSGDPSAKLMHAVRQVLNWKTWFMENLGYVTRYFPFSDRIGLRGLAEPELIVVIGRRGGIGREQQKLINQLGYRVQVRTFDGLAEQLSWPACEREQPLRTCRFVNGNVEAMTPLAEMRMKVEWEIIDNPDVAAKRRSSRRRAGTA